MLSGTETLREIEVALRQWTYPAALRAADGPAVTVLVAQLSERFGAGPERRIDIA